MRFSGKLAGWLMAWAVCSATAAAVGRTQTKPDWVFPVWRDGEYGYVDRTGGFRIKPRFEAAGRFREGRARVRLGGKYGFVDPTGKLVIPCELDDAGPFSEGLARAVGGDWRGYIDRRTKTSPQCNPPHRDTFWAKIGLAEIR